MRINGWLFMLFLIISSLCAFSEESTTILSLKKAIEIALENSLGLQASQASIDIMQARVQDAKSNVFPEIETRFVYPFVGTESGVSINQYIWDFKRTQNLIKASRSEKQSSEFEKTMRREDVILNTKIAYYTILVHDFMVDAAEKMVREHEKRLEQSEGFFKVGRISKIDLAKVKLNLGNAKINFINTKNNLEKSKIYLMNIMGIEGGFKYKLEYLPEYNKPDIDIDIESEINRAFDQRPEIHSLEAKEAAMKANLLAAKQDLYPKIFGRVEYRIRGIEATQPAFIAGVGIRFTVFEGFSKRSKIHEAKANLLLSDANIDSMRQQIESEVRQSYTDVATAEERIQVTEISKTSAEESLEFAKERYRLGRGSDVELAEAESLFASANVNYIQAILHYKIAIAQLERAIGKKMTE